MNNAADLYITNKNVKVDTFHGIFNLLDHIKNLKLNNGDSVYYVYDDVPENTDIPQIISNAKKRIVQNNLKTQVTFIPILCYEYSVLTAQYIEYFIQKKSIELVQKLKSYKITKKLTAETKNEPLFTFLYDRARKDQEKKLKSRGGTYSQNDIEKAVTVEKLCKKMLAEALHDDLHISNDFGPCWLNDCCGRGTRICCINTNSRNLSCTEKKQYLADYTICIKVLTKIFNYENMKLNDREPLNFNDVKLNKSVQQRINMCNPVFRKNVMYCKQNLESHYEAGKSRAEAIQLCKNDKFTIEEIQEALKDTPYNTR